MSDKRYLMAVDLGASNGRCVLGEWDGECLSAREILRFPNGPVETADGRLWWNVFAIYENIKKALKICVDEGCAPECIGIDSWAQDFGLIGKQGQPFAMPRCYRDSYTHEDHAAFMADPEKVDWLWNSTGTTGFSGTSLFQLNAQKKESPAVIESAASMLYIPNLLYYYMSGVVSCDCTLSSFSLLYDNEKKCWSNEVIEKFGLPDIFPEAATPGQIIGEASDEILRETGCRPKIALVAGHDTASALYAAPDGDDKETLVISSGTWSMMLSVSDKCPKEFLTPGCGLGSGLGARNEWIITGGVTGLWMFQQCKRRWEAEGRFPGYPALEGYAAEHTDIETYFDTEAPSLSWNQDMEAEIGKLCEEKGFAAPKDQFETYNTIMNSLARKYAETVKQFSELTGIEKKRIRLIGGGSKDPTLVALTKKHSGLEVLTGPIESSCAGNMMLQLVALGECKPGQRPTKLQGL
ncbi:MAG: hypothetical protein IJF27_08815 [Oscillospiraceae bacterium]|nr:hypothetical protein [Oscillospiraceae bacterium]MBQ3049341.1 hypothetical protein [Oscillospiraceae bacterium]MBQ9939266.1 hypothetical protein [Oscillospiraceae bacterium]